MLSDEEKAMATTVRTQFYAGLKTPEPPLTDLELLSWVAVLTATVSSAYMALLTVGADARTMIHYWAKIQERAEFLEDELDKRVATQEEKDAKPE